MKEQVIDKLNNVLNALSQITLYGCTNTTVGIQNHLNLGGGMAMIQEAITQIQTGLCDIPSEETK